ncbi:MAG: hypothetical protein JWR19_4248 [Pedosphaera sp.]|nr:hypothetical protein [Pedosphaera sp.]
MDVAADDALGVMFARHLRDGFLVFGDVFHRRFGLKLEIRREGPVTETEAAPDAVEVKIEIEYPVVEAGAEFFQDPVELGQAVKLMTMEHEIAFAIGGGVNHFAREGDAAEVDVEKLFQEFVVVAGEVNDLRFLAAFAEQFLDEHVIVVLPVPFRAQLPAVDEIADEIEIAALTVAQESEEGINLRVLGAEMDVGNPDRAKTHFARDKRFSVGDHNIL